jgi:signal transduction histidine kinase
MNWKIQAAFGSAILTLLVMGGISISSRSDALASQHWIQHTYQVLACLEQMEEALTVAETEKHIYLSSGDLTARSAFEVDMAKARLQLETAHGLTSDNMVQQRRFTTLEAMLDKDQHSIDEPADSFSITGQKESHIPADVGDLTDKLQNEELRLLKLRTDENGRRLQRSAPIQWIRILVGLSITLIGAWAVQRESKRRSEAELALRQGEERIRGLLQSAPDPWIVLDPHCNIYLLNAQTQAQFGYTQQELVGQSITALLPDGLPEKVLPEKFLPKEKQRLPHDELIEPCENPSPISRTIETRGMRKDGSLFTAEMTISSFETADGTLTSAALRDITDRRRAEQHLEKVRLELQRSNEELQRFAYVTSHDLQEPLRMVASYVQLLARRYQNKLDSDADEFIGYAVDGCIRMKRLIQDLLAYSRAGAEERSLKNISVEAVVDHALGNLRSSIKESGAEVTRDPLPSVIADETQLRQIFQNLIGNAIKYRRAATLRIHISAKQENESEWVFSVRDNGQGIEPEYFEKVFVIFQRLHANKGTEGTGIGLAICKRMIERLGGRIWVESEPQVGSTFFFSLPSRTPGIMESDTDRATAAGMRGEPKLRALPEEELARPIPQA